MIKETAIAVRQECEQLASEANDLRRELVTALDQVADDERRELLERKYLEGKSNAQLSAEYGVCERTVRRRLGTAIRDLDRFSGYFMG